MDNPQHYQPLSHALHPPLVPSQSRSPYPSSVAYSPPAKSATIPAAQTQMHGEQEQEEEEQDDDDEGVADELLELNDHEGERHGSAPPSPPRPNTAHGVSSSLQIVHDTSHTGDNKRRPGRPRGSKNRRPRAPPNSTRDSQPATQAGPPGPPPHPEINPQNQQYYEFQWRLLNLCAEFYGAAEELVKGTNPLVIAQCYHMGPTAKLDPLVMLAEARRNCDSLLANPSALVTNPPPPIYPVLPTLYSSGAAPAQGPSVQSTASPGSVITNPQSFVVPLGGQSNYPAPQYPVYATGQYPTTPYYQYSYPPPPGYYHPPPQTPSGSGGGALPTPTAPPSQPVAPTSATPVPALINSSSSSGAWSDDEVEKLRHLAEECKSLGGNGEIDWEHVIRNFGDKRTRHQILIKATNMGMKESSTRGVKRRRENESVAEPAGSVPSPAMTSLPSQPPTSHQPALQRTSSPSHSQPTSTSTPNASPSLQNLQRPSSAKGGSSVPPGNSMPWPMPTVAVNTASPVIPPSSTTPSHDQQRTSYYRPRPNQTDTSNKPAAPPHQHSGAPVHHYGYTPNGHSTSRQADPR